MKKFAKQISKWLIDITEAYPTPEQRLKQEWTQAIIAIITVITIGSIMYFSLWKG
jgi:hypothetical protein